MHATMMEKCQQSLQRMRNKQLDAEATIETYLQPDDKKPGFSDFVQWILTTDIPLDSIVGLTCSMPLVYTAVGMVELLDHLAYGLYDANFVIFVTVNGEPRLVIGETDSHDELVSMALLKSEKSDITKYTVERLDIGIKEFVDLCEQRQKAFIRKCFINDAVQVGSIAWCATNYRHYSQWEESWVKECQGEIVVLRGIRNNILSPYR